jgi:hypothetical protein
MKYIDILCMLLYIHMSEIEFEDSSSYSSLGRPNPLYSKLQESNERPGMVNFLIKKGIIGSEKAATIALLIASGIFFLSAVLLIYFYFYYTPARPANQKNTPIQVLIRQKTQQYIGQGLTAEEARARAVNEVTPNASTGK